MDKKYIFGTLKDPVIVHYGLPRRSGRYPWGSGKNPYHHGSDGNRTVFVSGSSKTQNKDSEYYRKKLPREVRDQLNSHMKQGNKIIVGDAPGIDRQVQDYLNKKKYSNVEVYGPGKEVRYSANKKWKTNPIDAPEFEEGSKEWLAKKDKAMSKAADEGIAVVLEEGSKATRKNIDRLNSQNKDVFVYELSSSGKERTGLAKKALEKRNRKLDKQIENLKWHRKTEVMSLEDTKNDIANAIRDEKKYNSMSTQQKIKEYRKGLTKQQNLERSDEYIKQLIKDDERERNLLFDNADYLQKYFENGIKNYDDQIKLTEEAKKNGKLYVKDYLALLKKD